MIGVLRCHDGGADGGKVQGGANRSHSRGKQERGPARILQVPQSLLERFLGLGSDSGVDEFALSWGLGTNVGRGQNDGGIDRGAGRAHGAPCLDDGRSWTQAALHTKDDTRAAPARHCPAEVVSQGE